VTGRPVRIVRVTEQSAEFLQFAEQHGLQPGTSVRVVDRNLTAELLTLAGAKGRTFALSTFAASKILVDRPAS